jgi:hypothetical protein
MSVPEPRRRYAGRPDTLSQCLRPAVIMAGIRQPCVSAGGRPAIINAKWDALCQCLRPTIISMAEIGSVSDQPTQTEIRTPRVSA